MVTDFLQGIIMLISLLAISLFLCQKFDAKTIFEAISNRPEGMSLLNPYDSNKSSFNIWWYLIMMFGIYYGYMGWQSTQGCNTSAKSPHEAKMAKIVSTFRAASYASVVIIAPLCAYTAMHHPSFSSLASDIRTTLTAMPNEVIREQMVTPIFLGRILPTGLIGLFCAVVACAVVASHAPFLHSWGSILIQDVLMPLRKKPLTPKQHMKWLRLSILGVAVFVFLWSVFLNFEEHIIMYWMITSSIFLAGSGSAIIGGLYWKQGTTAAAYAAMIIGGLAAGVGFVIRGFNPDFSVKAPMVTFLSAMISIITYVIVSLLQRKHPFDLDQMLHRGKYAIKDDRIETSVEPLKKWKKVLGISKEFNKRDVFIYFLTLSITVSWSVAAISVSVCYYYCKKNNIPFTEMSWFKWWWFNFYFTLISAVITTVWMAIGGILDMKHLFKTLAKAYRTNLDDGRVVDHRSLVDEESLSKVINSN